MIGGNKLTSAELTTRMKNAGNVTQVDQVTLQACAVVAHSGMMLGFQTETSPSGQKWAKLSHPRIMGGSRVLQDRGGLKNATQARATVNGIVASAAHPAANVHQYGATIRPKRAKRLTIPLTKEAYRAGRARRFPRKLFVVGGENNLFLAEKTKQKLIRHYFLAKQVVIAAREFVGFSTATLEKIDALLALRTMRKIVAVFDKSERVK